MKISVVHHGLHIAGGGERVAFSLLAALDRTGHDVELRCVNPPPGVLFSGQREAPPAIGGAVPDAEAASGSGQGAVLPPCEFRRIRLAQIQERRIGGGATDLDAEVRDLFSNTGSDLLVVTEGGFILDRTDAPEALLYANSDLGAESEILRRGFPRSPLRSPLRALRLRLAQAAFRRKMAMMRDGLVVPVPNTESTARAYARLVGRASLERVVYPPVDLGRFVPMGGAPREDRVVTTGRFSPEKNHELASWIMRKVGARWDAVGNARSELQKQCLAGLRKGAGPDMHFHVNAGEGELDEVLRGARVYLHARPESFGIAVVEAVAAGCVPVVPDNSAHPETVPFRELRYRTREEAVDKVRGALGGRFDHLLPALREHALQFSEDAFQKAMLGLIEARAP